MCPPPQSLAPNEQKPFLQAKYKYLIGALSLSTIVLLGTTIAFATRNKGNSSTDESAGVDFLTSKATSEFFATPQMDNACDGGAS